MKIPSSYHHLLSFTLYFFLLLPNGPLLGTSVDYRPVYSVAFDGAVVDNDVYHFPSSAELWAGFVNLAYIYPLSFTNGGTITFTGSAPNGNVDVRFRFEANPWPKTNPAYNSPLVTISGASPTEYSITIPSQGENTFNVALLYLNTRDTEVTLSDFTISVNPSSPSGPGGPGGPGGSDSNLIVDDPKRKILVLHGHNSYATGTQNWQPFRDLEYVLGNDYEFYYAQATGSTPDWYGNMDYHISYLSRIIDTEGPFYGVIGYSQGTSMIMTLINYKKDLPFERVVLFNGFAPGQIYWDFGNTNMQNILTELNAQKPFNNSVFVYAGDRDTTVPTSTSLQLVDFFKNSQSYVNYSAGHEPPSRYQGGFQEIIDFITSEDIDADGVDDSLDAYPHDSERHTSEPLSLSKNSASIQFDWDANMNKNWKIYKTSLLSSDNDTEIELSDCTLFQNRFSYSDPLTQDSCFYFLKGEK
ncbi:MAG: hypothetical protein ACJZ9L_03705 [Coraliomargaritaceae bacterium]